LGREIKYQAGNYLPLSNRSRRDCREHEEGKFSATVAPEEAPLAKSFPTTPIGTRLGKSQLRYNKS
jgi:hypothetical protein